MQLVFSGHQVNPPPVQHVGQQVSSPTYGDTNGTFRHNGSYYEDQNVLTVSFNPQIQVVNGLDPATDARVQAHEQEHYRDFAEKAERLRLALRRALQQGRDHQIDARWEWFNYDLREAANRYHQRSGQGDILPNNEPGIPRPV
jgi:hypothetical protein